MASTDGTTDFVVTVDGIGTFSFAKKTMRSQISIQTEYSRLTEGVETPTNFLANIASAMACLKVQTVSAPDGWDIMTMDPEDSESYQSIMKVWGALRDKQATFRARSGAKPQGDSTGTREGS